jgi:hypothetical protein
LYIPVVANKVGFNYFSAIIRFSYLFVVEFRSLRVRGPS